ncbi:hypothetical protein [Streptomyces lichenis]|uniref:Uncharacterized protein n=1 Tax=Streptomyces lichenis TaxID=2306967 RepID=A0ABT0IG25_9ACTN|nr:hypothetical protein [Streptomyces lichenis]MCK8680287.1 hypothetical protein [Streptomyces lichenis]
MTEYVRYGAFGRYPTPSTSALAAAPADDPWGVDALTLAEELEPLLDGTGWYADEYGIHGSAESAYAALARPAARACIRTASPLPVRTASPLPVRAEPSLLVGV